MTAKTDDQLRRIHEAMCHAFHELPSVLWRPTCDEFDASQDTFWLLQARATARTLPALVGVWSATGKWPLLDERSAYFLRVRLEIAARRTASQLTEERTGGVLESPPPESGDLEAIRWLLLEEWTDESDQSWAERAAREKCPPEVFLPLPREDLIGQFGWAKDRVKFPFSDNKNEMNERQRPT